MKVSQEIRTRIADMAQGSMLLGLAYIGIARSLFSTLTQLGEASAEEIAQATKLDLGYLNRWCDAALAFGLLEEKAGRFTLTELGSAFLPGPGSALSFPIQAMMASHTVEQVTTAMKTGETVPEHHLAEHENIRPLFGAALEANSSEMFEKNILSEVPAFERLKADSALAVDLGCGNGWYLRKLAQHYPHSRGIGLDGLKENIQKACELTAQAGLSERLHFDCGDIHNLALEEPADLIAMTRALHHVWTEKEQVFEAFKNNLKSGGVVIIWEPRWPHDRQELKAPNRQRMAFQNLSEHSQGNRFLYPEEIQEEFKKVGMNSHAYSFAGGNDMVIVGTKQ